MLAQHPLADQLLIQQGRIREHPHRHRAVHGGLELQVQHQVQPPLVVEAHAPHQVAVALPQVVADIAGRQRSEGGEVEGAAPVAGGEAVQQVLDHAWPGEQLFVRGIIHGATSQSYPGHPIHPGFMISR